MTRPERLRREAPRATAKIQTPPPSGQSHAGHCCLLRSWRTSGLCLGTLTPPRFPRSVPGMARPAPLSSSWRSDGPLGAWDASPVSVRPSCGRGCGLLVGRPLRVERTGHTTTSRPSEDTTTWPWHPTCPRVAAGLPALLLPAAARTGRAELSAASTPAFPATEAAESASVCLRKFTHLLGEMFARILQPGF